MVHFTSKLFLFFVAIVSITLSYALPFGYNADTVANNEKRSEIENVAGSFVTRDILDIPLEARTAEYAGFLERSLDEEELYDHAQRSEEDPELAFLVRSILNGDEDLIFESKRGLFGKIKKGLKKVAGKVGGVVKKVKGVVGKVMGKAMPIVETAAPLILRDGEAEY